MWHRTLDTKRLTKVVSENIAFTFRTPVESVQQYVLGMESTYETPSPIALYGNNVPISASSKVSTAQIIVINQLTFETSLSTSSINSSLDTFAVDL